jgi:hypothetical protein
LRSGRIGLRLKTKKKTPAKKKTAKKKTAKKKTPAKKKKSYISGVSDAELKAHGLGPASWYEKKGKK